MKVLRPGGPLGLFIFIWIDSVLKRKAKVTSENIRMVFPVITSLIRTSNIIVTKDEVIKFYNNIWIR